MICESDQLSWGCTLGYDEAKTAEPNPNIGALASDFLRLVVMATKIIGKSEMHYILAFQIRGK
ncbi:hypothetical protein BDF21DRAFT_335013 [Thamnidium elegans]|nr:hypothetical protein BDF21DRAFT_335013 [Thamnidium elegans]